MELDCAAACRCVFLLGLRNFRNQKTDSTRAGRGRSIYSSAWKSLGEGGRLRVDFESPVYLDGAIYVFII